MAAKARFAQLSSDNVHFVGEGDTDASTAATPPASEYDEQIAQLDAQLVKAQQSVKESEACASRLASSRAQVLNLNAQKDHLNKEKKKRILKGVLMRNMDDLQNLHSEANALRKQFNDLKAAQASIKAKIADVQAQIKQFDPNAAVDYLESNGKSEEQAKNELAWLKSTAEESLAMHKAQFQILKNSHSLEHQGHRH